MEGLVSAVLTFEGEAGVELLLALHMHLEVACVHSLQSLLFCVAPEGTCCLMTSCVSLRDHHIIVQGNVATHLLTVPLLGGGGRVREERVSHGPGLSLDV